MTNNDPLVLVIVESNVGSWLGEEAGYHESFRPSDCEQVTGHTNYMLISRG